MCAENTNEDVDDEKEEKNTKEFSTEERKEENDDRLDIILIKERTPH